MVRRPPGHGWNVPERLVGRPAHGSPHWRVLMLVTALLLVLATPVVGLDGATYGARPAPGAGDRSAGSFNLSVGTGSSVTDAVEILNFSDDAAAFDVYVADAVLATGGGLAPAAREAEITGPAAWITVDEAMVEVSPRDSTIVSFAVKVPTGTRIGDYTAALLVQPLRSSDGGAVGTTTRVGLWVMLEVTEAEGGVEGGTAMSGSPAWILATLLGLALVAWLMYVTRRPRRRWVEQRREEQALLRDFRSRHRRGDTSGSRR